MKYILAILAILAIGFSSCEKADRLAQFTVTDNIQLTIEANPDTLVPFDVYSAPVYSEASRELTANNTKADMMETVTLQEFRMVITQPFGRSWEFLKDIEVFIDADQLPEQKIAFQYSLTNAVSATILLKKENTQLLEYLKKGTYIIRTRLTADKEITDNLDINISTKYAVGAKVLDL